MSYTGPLCGAPFPVRGIPVVLLLLGALCPSLYAQHYHTRIYTEVDGLPSSEIHGITQDDQGSMWFATRSGLARYDGREWLSYDRRHGFYSPDQGKIMRAEDGTLWSFSTQDPVRVYRYDGETWIPLPLAPQSNTVEAITGVAISEAGTDTRILIGTVGGRLVFWDGTVWEVIQDRRGPGYGIRSISRWQSYFLIARARGIDYFDPAKPEFGIRPFDELPRGPVFGVKGDSAGKFLWVVGADWIGRLDHNGFTYLDRGLDFSFSLDVTTLVAESDNAGGIYFGNQTALLYYHPDKGLESLDQSSGLSAIGTTALFRDREGNIWVGGYRGLTKIIGRRYVSYSSEHGLPVDEVSAVLERRNGEIVLGHPGAVTFFREELRVYAVSDNPLHGRVLDLVETPDGTVWIAANYAGLFKITPDGELQPVSLPSDSHESELVYSLACDPEGRLVVCSSVSIHRLESDRFNIIENDFPPNQNLLIRRVLAMEGGTIIGAAGWYGLIQIRDGTSSIWTHQTQPEVNNIFTVSPRPDGEFWVGSGVGLFRTAEGGLLEKVILPGLSIDRPVYFITDDKDGRTWIGTDNGVIRYDGGESTHITVRDGLIGLETNRAAGLCDSRGRMWIGTDRGVTVFDPSYQNSLSSGPTVEFLDLDAGGFQYELLEDAVLPSDRNTLIFRFRAISFIDESRIRYRTWLEGFDAGWQEPIDLPLRELRFTNLPPGDYRMHIEAIDVMGRVSDVATSPVIRIRRPLWKSAWILSLAGLLLIALVYGIASSIWHRRYAKKLEREVRDRTRDLRDSEESIAAEKRRLEATISSIADGVVVYDKNDDVVLWSSAAERITGWSPQEMVGKNMDEIIGLNFVTPDEVILLGHQEGALGGCPAIEIRTRNGEKRWLEFSAAPFLTPDEKSMAGRVFAFRDVTDRLRMERDLIKTERLEALGVLAGGIAHDFNNLLTIMIGNLSLAEEIGSVPEPGLGKIRSAKAAANQARTLTQRLLTFSTGGAPVLRTASIEEVIRESAALILSGSNVLSEISIDDQLYPVEIDRGQMSQVINNLLLNARQSMPAGGLLRIRAKNSKRTDSDSGENLSIVIEIQDEGPGISAEDRHRIFDPYYSTKEGGTGLGLSTAHSIVERHGGRLSLESIEGNGCIFRIDLAAVSRDRLVPSVKRHLSDRSGSGRILVMDDEEMVRDVVEAILNRLGYSSVHATDGKEAIDVYKREYESGKCFDAVIMDLTIPGGMGGKETVQKLREFDPGVVAIAVSGYSNDPVMARTEDFGFRASLSKPFEVSELASVLSDLLGGNGS